MASLSSAYAKNSITGALCGFSTEQILQGREDGEEFIFPGMDRIRTLAQTDPQYLLSLLANARLLLKE